MVTQFVGKLAEQDQIAEGEVWMLHPILSQGAGVFYHLSVRPHVAPEEKTGILDAPVARMYRFARIASLTPR